MGGVPTRNGSSDWERRSRSPICFASAFVAKPARATYVMHFAASGEQALELLAGEIEPQLIVILSEIKSTCPAWMG
jgi:hypothetical protein